MFLVKIVTKKLDLKENLSYLCIQIKNKMAKYVNGKLWDSEYTAEEAASLGIDNPYFGYATWRPTWAELNEAKENGRYYES